VLQSALQQNIPHPFLPSPSLLTYLTYSGTHRLYNSSNSKYRNSFSTPTHLYSSISILYTNRSYHLANPPPGPDYHLLPIHKTVKPNATALRRTTRPSFLPHRFPSRYRTSRNVNSKSTILITSNQKTRTLHAPVPFDHWSSSQGLCNLASVHWGKRRVNSVFVLYSNWEGSAMPFA